MRDPQSVNKLIYILSLRELRPKDYTTVWFTKR